MLDVKPSVEGRLHAAFSNCDGRSVARVTVAGAPLELRGPIDDGASSRFYVRNISCGVFGGDSYDVSLRARDGASAFVTATSATKVHAMPRAGAVSVTRLESSPGAAIAYYDGPTILQAGSDLTQRVEIVAAGGLAIYAEVLVWGRLARNEVLAFRRYRSEMIVRDECARALFVERYELRPDWCVDSDLASTSPPVLGKVIVTGAMDDRVQANLAAQAGDLNVGCDELPSGAGYMVRVVGERMDTVADGVERTVLDLLDGSTRSKRRPKSVRVPSM